MNFCFFSSDLHGNAPIVKTIGAAKVGLYPYGPWRARKREEGERTVEEKRASLSLSLFGNSRIVSRPF